MRSTIFAQIISNALATAALMRRLQTGPGRRSILNDGAGLARTFFTGGTYINPGRKTPVKAQLAHRAEIKASAGANSKTLRPTPSPGMVRP